MVNLGLFLTCPGICPSNRSVEREVRGRWLPPSLCLSFARNLPSYPTPELNFNSLPACAAKVCLVPSWNQVPLLWAPLALYLPSGHSSSKFPVAVLFPLPLDCKFCQGPTVSTLCASLFPHYTQSLAPGRPQPTATLWKSVSQASWFYLNYLQLLAYITKFWSQSDLALNPNCHCPSDPKQKTPPIRAQISHL